MAERIMAVALAEVADVLAQHGDLRCAPEVEKDGDGAVRLTVTVACPSGALGVVELFYGLRHVCGVGQMRSLAVEYGIDESALIAFLRKQGRV